MTNKQFLTSPNEYGLDLRLKRFFKSSLVVLPHRERKLWKPASPPTDKNVVPQQKQRKAEGGVG
jgi:hypothetical protein